jgi:hypothetical protein
MVELYSNADGSIQFVELQAFAGDQQFMTGHPLASASNAQPPVNQTFTFPADLPGDTAGRRMLIATEGFAALGVVTPDYIVPNGFFFPAGGTLNFAGGFDVWSHPELPSNNESIDRSGTPSTPTPMNFAGVTGTLPAEGTDSDGDGIPDLVEPGRGRNPMVKDNDVFADATLFTMQQYRDFLNREGDPAGIAFWADRLEIAFNTRAQVVDFFFNSAEFQDTVAPVTRLYFAYFLRIPDYPGLQFWINYFKAGNSLHDISNFFAASPEFTSTYGSLTNAQFVTLVYDNVLGREPDQAGFDFWLNQLEANAMTRGQVMLAFSESAEYRATSFNMVYVTMTYAGMLRRAPDQGGFDFWVNYLATGNSGLALINGFIGAPEYRARFLP